MTSRKSFMLKVILITTAINLATIPVHEYVHFLQAYSSPYIKNPKLMLVSDPIINITTVGVVSE